MCDTVSERGCHRKESPQTVFVVSVHIYFSLKILHLRSCKGFLLNDVIAVTQDRFVQNCWDSIQLICLSTLKHATITPDWQLYKGMHMVFQSLVQFGDSWVSATHLPDSVWIYRWTSHSGLLPSQTQCCLGCSSPSCMPTFGWMNHIKVPVGCTD